MFAAEWRWQGVWHSFPFLAWALSMHPRTQIWFFNQFICIRACACSSNLNYAHKCIENSINASKCPNKPRKIPKNDTTLMLFYVDTRNFLKAIRGNGYRFVKKVRRSLPKPSCLLWEALVCEKHVPKPAPNQTKFYHDMLMPLHDSMPSFMNFGRALDLLEFKNQVSQCLQPSDRGRVFDIHSHFLHGT